MQATLTFNIPEDEFEFEIARKGGNYIAALSEYREYLRSLHKYSEHETVSIEDIYEKFFEVLSENNITTI